MKLPVLVVRFAPSRRVIALLGLVSVLAQALGACAGSILDGGSTPAPVSEAAASSADCDRSLTASDAEGPYYKANAPERDVLVEPGMDGTRLILNGLVMTGDCQPIGGALLDFWQADANGEYDNSGYTLRGRLFTDESGTYRLETVVPGIYPGRPAHIHVKVSLPDGREFTTQIYFVGEEFGGADRQVDPSLLTQLEHGPDGSVTARFDFMLPSD